MNPFNRAWLKRTLTLFLPVCVLMCAFSYRYYHDQAGKQLEHRGAPVRAWLAFAEVRLAELMQGVGRDAVLLAGMPGFGSQVNPDVLEPGLRRFMASRPEYTRVQLFDMKGQPLLTLERRARNISSPTPRQASEETLALVQGMVAARPGVVQVGALALETEEGKIRLPHRPLVSFSTLYADENDTPVGVVQIQYDGTALYDHIAFGRPAETLSLWVLESEGQWMFGGSEKDNWRWQFPHNEGHTLGERHVALWRAMQTHAEGMADLPSGLFVYRQLDPFNTVTAENLQNKFVLLSSSQPSQLWHLVAPVRSDIRQAWLNAVLRDTLILSLSGLTAIFFLAVCMGYVLTRQFRRLEIVQDRRNFLLQILEKAPIGAIMHDDNGARIYVNPHWLLLTGFTTEQAMGDGWHKAIHPDDLNGVLAGWSKVIKEKQTVELEYRFLRPDGEISWIRCALLPLLNDSQQAMAYIGVMADITPLKSQEAVLLASKEKVEWARAELDNILNSSNDPIVAIDMGFSFTVFNLAYSNLLRSLYDIRIERGDCLLNLLEHLPEDRSTQMILWGRALQGECFIVRRTIGDESRDRRTFDLSFSPHRDLNGVINGAVMIMRDVTVAARVESALRRSEELFRSATESSLDAIIVLAAVKDATAGVIDFRVEECNQIALDLWGRKRADVMGVLLGRIMRSYREDGLFDRLCSVYQTNIPFEEARRNMDPDIHAEWLHCQIVALSDGITLSLRDITQRKQIERRLLENEARISAILANVQEGIVTLDAAGVLRSANPACERIFGYAASDLVGKPFAFLFPELSGDPVGPDAGNNLLKNIAIEIDGTREVTGRRLDGMQIPLEISFKPVSLGGEIFYTGTLHDITERKAYESGMQQSIAELESLQESLNETNDQLSYANRELLRLAHLDGLTGLANRRFFDQTFHAEWLRAVRDHQSLSVVMLDVDHFKRYNDGYGHQAGDECLKIVAASINRGLRRPGDFAARYGGEEFIVILPNTDIDGAELVAHVILEDIRNQAIPHANSPTAAWVTVSAGVASILPNARVDESILVSSADQALYHAKQRGRDRCVDSRAGVVKAITLKMAVDRGVSGILCKRVLG